MRTTTMLFNVVLVVLIVSLGGVRALPRCLKACIATDTRVCAQNDGVAKEFSSQCYLNNFNCLNPTKQFEVVDRNKCRRLDIVSI